MNKIYKINKIIRTAVVGATLAVVFTVAFAAPAFAEASYGYGANYGGNYNHIYSTPSYIVSNSGHNYGYNYSRPAQISPIVITQPTVVYQQPQVIYQQPQVIYQQPQVVYQTQPVYQQPVYYQTYSPLTVSCYANTSSVTVGQNVTWEAYASGGNGSYNYTWSGTNSSYSNGATAYSIYYNPGSYTASVTVYSGDGQSVTQSCGYASVVGSYSYNYAPTTYAYNYPTTYTSEVPAYTVTSNNIVNNQNVGGNLVAACFANKTTATVGSPVTWAVEVTGGTGQYTYSWSGSDGLSGTSASVTQSYGTTGLKNATVLVNSNGQTISQACGDSVSIKSYVSPAETNYQGAPTNKVPSTNNTSNSNTTNPNSLSAAALLGLGSIPWGWIAILIIIVLGVTVFYLIFNRTKV